MVSALAAAPGVAPLGGAPAPARLPPLRDDLTLLPGPPTPDGAPTWTLHDPAANRWFRVGWLEMEVLTRWPLGTAESIAAAIGRDTTIAATPEEVEEVARFLMGSGLLRPQGPAGTEALLRQSAARRLSPAMWLLKNYLFIRIPLVRPDRLLGWLAPRLSFLFTPAFLALVLLVALAGGVLVGRQWDSFLHGFPHLFTPEGVLTAGAALFASKALHEMAHGLTAKRFGCRVPTMGVALLVLWPVMYTDTSEAWRLTSRRQRLAIGAAGMAAELALAAFATLAWVFMPDGPLRSALFVLATSTWVITLAVNLSPFMRFDGYYLLSDLLDVANLQDRAFALGRWSLRERLFGFGEPPPEAFAPRLRRLLVAYAWFTWAYRFFLFLGIAILVYHLFFKLLGIFMFAVEIWWFILRPVMAELKGWAERRDAYRLNRRTAGTLAGLGLLLLAVLVPWPGRVAAPALVQPVGQAVLFAPRGAQVAAVHAREGERLAAGQPVITLASPELDYHEAANRARLAALQAQIAGQNTSTDLAQDTPVLESGLRQVAATLAGLAAERARLVLRAPADLVLDDLPDALRPGSWVQDREPLATLRSRGRMQAVAYVPEAAVARLSPGAGARFVPEDLSLPPVPLRLASIAATATRDLDEAELASTHGGPIAARQLPDNRLVADGAVYRLVLLPAGDAALPDRAVRGEVVVEAASESVLTRAWRTALGVLIREMGF